MSPKLKISSFVIKRIENIKSQCSGCLFGLMYEGTILILGFNIEYSSGIKCYKKIQNNFPAELDLFGIIKFGDCTNSQERFNEILQDIDVTDNPILLQCDLDEKSSSTRLHATLFKHGQMEEIQFDVMSDDELFSEFIYTRLECNLDVICDEDDDKSVRTSMQNLRKHLASGKAGFNIKNTSIYLTCGKTGKAITGIESSSKISDLLMASSYNSSGDQQTQLKSKKKVVATEFEILKVVLLFSQSSDCDDKKNNSTTRCVINSASKTMIPLQLDGLAMLYKKTSVTALYDILIESLCRSIRLIENSVIDQKFVTRNSEVGFPKIFNFLPKQLGHFFSCVYFSRCSDDDVSLQQYRKKFHQQFSLPITRPCFRRGNRYLFKEEDTSCQKYLINPHIGVKPILNDGKQYLVTGKYTYFHYMQDGFDDNGWGCAYRSLQTLCSWFKWQGYTDRSIPTHKEIQTHLVDIGDKPTNFIGSKQWIGSMEVSMCLQGFMKIVSRIQRVDSGAELANYGPILARHFETNGTPIMIGGGVLAHTILGIHYNSTSGELKFLILDPHYTGMDDLQIVQSKRWCGWKGCDFWDKKSYYNLCMPQLPTSEFF